MRYKRLVRAKYSTLQYLGLLIPYRVYAFKSHTYYTLVMSVVKLGYKNKAKTKLISTLRLLTSYIISLTRLTK
jgi:hypothetical protein